MYLRLQNEHFLQSWLTFLGFTVKGYLKKSPSWQRGHFPFKIPYSFFPFLNMML